MSKIKDTFFGGAEKRAGKKLAQSAQEGQRLIGEGVTQARQEIKPLFQQAGEARERGFQQALDVFGQTVPQQAELFQGGNVAAQNAQLAGLPQIQNAILGLPTDFSGLQPTQLNFDPSAFQQTLAQPEFQPIPAGQSILQGLGPTGPNINPFSGQRSRFGPQRFED